MIHVRTSPAPREAVGVSRVTVEGVVSRVESEAVHVVLSAGQSGMARRVPQVWGKKIPPRNRNLTGREDLLDTLRGEITGRTGITGKVTAVISAPHALHGLGGVGKTQMAVE
jgi:hypothetical protein